MVHDGEKTLGNNHSVLKKENVKLKREIADLKKRKQMLDVALRSTSITIRVVDADGIIQYDNAANKSILGYAYEDVIGRSTFKKVHPDDKERVLKVFNDAIANPPAAEPASVEFRLKHKDGRYLWVHGELRFIIEDGVPARGIATVWDITEKKQMEDDLHALAQKLNAAREEERAHTALRIHNDFGQSITGLKFELSDLIKKIPMDHQKALEKTKEIMQSIDNMTELIKRISSEYGPPILDDFGLKTALEWQARDFQEKTGIRVFLKPGLDPAILVEREKAIAIFRICQEALTNVARHASATQVTIGFWQDDGRLCLCIKDNGRGIRGSEITNRTSLGIRSMKGRALSMGGNFEINGQPNHGTVIQCGINLN